MGPNRNKTIQMFRILQDSIPFAAAFIRGLKAFLNFRERYHFSICLKGHLLQLRSKGCLCRQSPAVTPFLDFISMRERSAAATLRTRLPMQKAISIRITVLIRSMRAICHRFFPIREMPGMRY